MSVANNPVYQLMCRWHDELVALRRELHRHPEIAFQETSTSDRIAAQLEGWGISVNRGLARTGVVGTLRQGTSSRSIGLRADMDSLEMAEANEFAHRSIESNRFHGCGHDGHMTMLVAAARYLASERGFDGTVHLIFQPAEENEGGGRVMVEEGLFEQFPCDAVFGMHNIPGIPLGSFAVRGGAMMAGFDVFEIELLGVGGHAAMPDRVSDVIVAAGQLITALQSIVSRNVAPTDSAVLSVTQVHAGSTYNVLPESARIVGTVRHFCGRIQQLIERRIHTLTKSIAEAHELRVRIRYERRYPPTINDPDAAALSADVLARTFGEDRVNRDPVPLMAAEDFAFMLQRTPGAYIWAGNGDGAGACGLHNPHYDFNDDLISLGATYWVELVRAYLAQDSTVTR